MIKKIDHLGIAVKSLEKARAVYENVFGVKGGPVEEVAEQKVRVIMFEVGQSRIELLEPTSDDGPIAVFLARRGPGLHHVAYAVDDIEAAIEKAEAAGARMIDRKPRAGAHGARIAFVHPKSSGGVLTELCQRD